MVFIKEYYQSDVSLRDEPPWHSDATVSKNISLDVSSLEILARVCPRMGSDFFLATGKQGPRRETAPSPHLSADATAASRRPFGPHNTLRRIGAVPLMSSRRPIVSHPHTYTHNHLQ